MSESVIIIGLSTNKYATFVQHPTYLRRIRGVDSYAGVARHSKVYITTNRHYIETNEITIQVTFICTSKNVYLLSDPSRSFHWSGSSSHRCRSAGLYAHLI